MNILRWILLPAFFSAVLSFQARAENPLRLPEAGKGDGGLVTLRVGNRRINVEVASTSKSQEQGLMQRANLCEDCGMLFVFEKPVRYGFWMKDTFLPLSIAFISAGGEIINIEEMEPNSMAMHYAQGNYQYALEMNSGWFERNGITPSARVRGSSK
jgi:uncharacterized membrane protein (UPF0127 family)